MLARDGASAPAQAASSRAPASAKSVKRLGKMARALERKLRGDAKTVLCKYFFVGRRHFSKVGSISFSLDAARLGRLTCMLGNTATPDGTLMWAPPQVRPACAWGAPVMSGCPPSMGIDLVVDPIRVCKLVGSQSRSMSGPIRCSSEARHVKSDRARTNEFFECFAFLSTGM